MRRVGVFDLGRMVEVMKESINDYLSLSLFDEYTDEEKETLSNTIKGYCAQLVMNLCEETVDVERRGGE